MRSSRPPVAQYDPVAAAKALEGGRAYNRKKNETTAFVEARAMQKNMRA